MLAFSLSLDGVSNLSDARPPTALPSTQDMFFCPAGVEAMFPKHDVHGAANVVPNAPVSHLQNIQRSASLPPSSGSGGAGAIAGGRVERGDDVSGKTWTREDDELLIRFKIKGEPGLSFQSIAAATGRTYNAVKSRWNNTLRKRYEDEEAVCPAGVEAMFPKQDVHGAANVVPNAPVSHLQNIQLSASLPPSSGSGGAGAIAGGRVERGDDVSGKTWTREDDELLIRFKIKGEPGLSFRSIAAATGRTYNAVKSRWNNALRKKYEDEEADA